MKTINQALLTNQINILSDTDKIALHNWYCEETNDLDSAIHAVEDVGDYYDHTEKPLIEVLDELSEVNYQDRYFNFNGRFYESFNDVDDHIFPSDIARFIDRNLDIYDFNNLLEELMIDINVDSYTEEEIDEEI